jgi:N-methylhydantoinase A/oxoprolinase/acetone carboxylase beta subunit
VYRLGVDVGGTFTDVVCHDPSTGHQLTAKILSTPDDPAKAVLEGVRELMEAGAVSSAELGDVVHGTTLVSNALIQRTGAVTGLLTTAGFRDILETRTEKRYDMYDFNARLPEPLVPRRRRLGIIERLDETGAPLVPLDEASVVTALARLKEAKVESIAVCLLHAYRNPEHELRIRDLLKSLGVEVPVSLSCEVAPMIREYPRLSTTVANAYVRPLMTRYLEGVRQALAAVGFRRSSHVLVSGGVITEAVAARVPIRMVDSGPAAAALGAAAQARLAERPVALSFEMGGTTAKFCFIDRGEPTLTNGFEVARVDRFRKGSGHLIALPALDMMEIGAGGGSIAWLDRTGLLKVGPQSAGAVPGPACYDRGGQAPTVTDANLLLGYLDPERLLGGAVKLSRDRARETIERVASRVGMSVMECAWAIHEIVTENMVNAAREHVAEHGRDPRKASLVASGGAGPSHAVRFAERLGSLEVIWPSGAGVSGALGALVAPLAFDLVRTYVTLLSNLDLAYLNRLLGDLEQEGTALLLQAGVRPEHITTRRSCEMRYVGQTHELPISVPGGLLGPDGVDELRRTYGREYERLYRHPDLGYELEAVNWRVFVSSGRPDPPIAVPTEASRAAELVRHRRAFFPECKDLVDCPVWTRSSVMARDSVVGPAIIEDTTSSLVVPPGFHATPGRHGALLVTRHA